VKAGIEVEAGLRIPDELVPLDAQVEIDAKMAAGYFTDGRVRTAARSPKPRTTDWSERRGPARRGRSPAPPGNDRERCAKHSGDRPRWWADALPVEPSVCPRSPISWRRSRAGVIPDSPFRITAGRHLDAGGVARVAARAALSRRPAAEAARAPKST